MRTLLLFAALLSLLPNATAQSNNRRAAAAAAFDDLVRWNPVFAAGHSGFSLCDLSSGDQLYGYQAEQYFVPASNVKLLTFYVAQQLLGDRVPALYTYTHGDTTEAWGTGYPLLLHPAFHGYDGLAPMLRGMRGVLRLHTPPDQTPPRYGAGWSWDDYNYGYVYERSALPVYGNRLYLDYLPEASTLVPEFAGSPPEIASALIQDEEQERNIDRREGSNQFTVGPYFYDPENFPLERPLTVSPALTAGWLSAAFPNLSIRTGREPVPPPGVRETTYVALPDTVYRRLLQDSDNYLAEQLVLMAAAGRYGWGDEETFFDFAVDTLFRGIQLGDLRYADGSGLSRYNLVRPRQFTQLITALAREVGVDRLTALLPAGGESGTLERRFGNRPETYVWAKTGTLSGVACVSGLLRCRSGRWLSFSFLHNNIMGRTSDYYKQMEEALGWAYDNL